MEVLEHRTGLVKRVDLRRSEEEAASSVVEEVSLEEEVARIVVAVASFQERFGQKQRKGLTGHEEEWAGEPSLVQKSQVDRLTNSDHCF